MTAGERDVISSLRQLPRDIAPPRDLWRGIEAQLGAQKDAAVTDNRAQRFRRARWIAAAAVFAALAVGIWIGRSVLPGSHPVDLRFAQSTPPEAVQGAYMMDAKYVRERAALVQSLEAQLATLPPETRTKVMASLTTIHDSIRDLEAALGRDPTNALLQELLVNTYQDEMRVLTAVHEAGGAGKGI